MAGLSLEDLLIFMTGADCVPPLGFGKKITVDFYNFEENSRRRPYVSTCGLYFFLHQEGLKIRKNSQNS